MERFRRLEPYTIVVVVATVVMTNCVAGLLFRERFPVSIPPRVWVIAASSCFVFVGWRSWTLLQERTSFCVLLGLLGCWLGDYLGLKDFVSGAISFFVAHLFFILAWAQRGFAWTRVPTVLAGVLTAAGCCAAWLLPHVPRSDLPLVLGYMGVISAMVVTAGSADLPRWPVTLTAAAVFFVSDIAVARWRFVTPGDVNAWFCYPLYYAACLMLAVSPVVNRPQDAQTTERPTREGSAT